MCFTSRPIIPLHIHFPFAMKSSLMASKSMWTILNKRKTGIFFLFLITSCKIASSHLLLLLVLFYFIWYMGWLCRLDRGSTIAMGNFGIIYLLNCNPMSARMALNIPKHFITFLSIFILYPLWAWGIKVTVFGSFAVQCTCLLITAGPFIRHIVMWPTKVVGGPAVADT